MIVLITGASAGFGAEMARKFVGQGHQVIAAARRADDTAASKIYEGPDPLTSADIAEAAYWVATLPAHVNNNIIEMMPTCQGYGVLNIKRNPGSH